VRRESPHGVVSPASREASALASSPLDQRRSEGRRANQNRVAFTSAEVGGVRPKAHGGADQRENEGVTWHREQESQRWRGADVCIPTPSELERKGGAGRAYTENQAAGVAEDDHTQGIPYAQPCGGSSHSVVVSSFSGIRGCWRGGGATFGARDGASRAPQIS
jgi:hypothetical protein